MNNNLPTVYIVTCVRNDEPLTQATATLTFHTLRIGFPNSPVVVIDNASTEKGYNNVKFLSEFAEVDMLVSWKERRTHAKIIDEVLNHNPDERIVLLDPDIIFWKSCEDWTFDTILAGRQIPVHLNEYTKCVEAGRLHTSFLWVDTYRSLFKKVFNEVYEGIHSEYSPVDLITPRVNFFEGKPYFWDTMAPAYHAIGGTSFNEEHLDCYDHLYAGSALDIAKETFKNNDSLTRVHELVLAGKLDKLKGIWRQQQNYLNKQANLITQ